MAKNQSEMFIEDGIFFINEQGITETMRLHGKYQIKKIRNKALPTLPDDFYSDMNIPCQAVYTFGNVLVRSTTEGIEELIDLFIRYTYDPCKDLELDLIHENEQMRWGTICPTKKTLFKYRSKVFIAYGRYIFGYYKLFAEFRRVRDGEKDFNNDDSDDDEEKWNSSGEEKEDDDGRKKQDVITQDQIILKYPDDEELSRILRDHVYLFCIYDEESGVLDAFGLYR